MSWRWRDKRRGEWRRDKGQKRTVSGSFRSLPMRARFSKARLMEAKAVATGVRAAAPAEGMAAAKGWRGCL